MYINCTASTIELTKKEFKSAHIFGSEDYKNLQQARRDYPGYDVITKQRKQRDNLKGLDDAYIKRYLATHDDEDHTNAQLYNAMILDGVSFFERKEWFVETFPEIKEFGQVTRYSDAVNSSLTAVKMARIKKQEADYEKAQQSRRMALDS